MARSRARLMVVPTDTESTLRLGGATVAFEGAFYTTGVRQYDVAADGRFLMIKSEGTATEDAAPGQIVVVENWFSELDRLVPAN